jgi:hypothetical protein
VLKYFSRRKFFLVAIGAFNAHYTHTHSIRIGCITRGKELMMNYFDDAFEDRGKNRDRANMARARGMSRNPKAMDEGLAEVAEMKREAPVNEGGGDQN